MLDGLEDLLEFHGLGKKPKAKPKKKSKKKAAPTKPKKKAKAKAKAAPKKKKSPAKPKAKPKAKAAPVKPKPPLREPQTETKVRPRSKDKRKGKSFQIETMDDARKFLHSIPVGKEVRYGVTGQPETRLTIYRTHNGMGERWMFQKEDPDPDMEWYKTFAEKGAVREAYMLRGLLNLIFRQYTEEEILGDYSKKTKIGPKKKKNPRKKRSRRKRHLPGMYW